MLLMLKDRKDSGNREKKSIKLLGVLFWNCCPATITQTHNIYMCFLCCSARLAFPSSAGSDNGVFVTVKPVKTEAAECVLLERHGIKCDRCIGNVMLSNGSFRAISHWFMTGYWWESQLFPVPLPEGNGVCPPKKALVWHLTAQDGIDKEHLFSPLKCSGEIARSTACLRCYLVCAPLRSCGLIHQS